MGAAAGGAAHELARGRPVAPETESAVEGQQAHIAVALVLVDGHGADDGTFADVTVEAQVDEVGAPFRIAVVAVDELAVGVQGGPRVAARFSRGLDTQVDLLHPARVEQAQGQIEEFRSVAEEGPAFGQGQLAVVVDVDQRRVALQLREVREHGQVADQAARGLVDQVDPGVSIVGAALESAVAGIGQEIQAGRLRSGRNQLESPQFSELGYAAEATARVGPGVGLLVDGAGPPEVHTPGRALLIVLQLRQRYGELGGPVIRVLLHLRLPRGIPGKGEGALVADALVHLGRKGVDAEDVGIAAVVVGVEDDLDGVVGPDPGVASGQGFPEPGHVRLPASKAYIDRCGIVEDEGLRSEPCGHAASLLGAEEVAGHLGSLPGRLGEVAVDARLADGRAGPVTTCGEGRAGRWIGGRPGGLQGERPSMRPSAMGMAGQRSKRLAKTLKRTGPCPQWLWADLLQWQQVNPAPSGPPQRPARSGPGPTGPSENR